MKFRCRDTGDVLTQRDVIRTRRSNEFRYFTAEEDGKVVRKTRPMVLTFPQNEEGWLNPKFLNIAAIDPVYAKRKPTTDSLHVAVPGDLVEEDGRWFEEWSIVPRFGTIEAWRSKMQHIISRKASAVRKGGIVVDGMPVKTDEAALIMAVAADTGASRNWVSGSAVRTLSAHEVHSIRIAIEQHIQACFDYEAQLLLQVQAATEIMEIDVERGWPNV